MGELIVFIVCVAIFVWAVYAYRKNSKELKAKGVVKRLVGKHIEGVPFMNSGQLATLDLYKDKITVGANFSIPLQDIKNICVCTEKELIEKERSVLGRAVVGGALLGPLGAVVGGLSGAKNKKTTEKHTFLVIDFNNSESVISQAKFSTGRSSGDYLFVKQTIASLNTAAI